MSLYYASLNKPVFEDHARLAAPIVARLSAEQTRTRWVQQDIGDIRFMEKLAKRVTAHPETVILRDDAASSFDCVGDDIRAAMRGEFHRLPKEPSWKEILCFAVAIDGAGIAQEWDVNVHILGDVAGRRFRISGAWPLDPVILWCVLYAYNRKNHWNSGWGFEPGESGRTEAESCYQALRDRLQSEGHAMGEGPGTVRRYIYKFDNTLRGQP
ncbi:MAG: hypothetical protein IT577_13780 [Verrucomicrobiae bacterium]|nr:hypothetical protein [Verrucomicrobiae bacterium]